MTRGHDILANMGPAARRLNSALLSKEGIAGPPEQAPAHTAKPPCAGKRLRQSSREPNKTERRFWDYLRVRYPGKRIYFQSITLLLANGVRYTPDFVTEGGSIAPALTAYEVKGFMRDDAAVKLKVAADTYPFIDFWLVWRERGDWGMQRILPSLG